jgi:hypothetical protein
MALNSARTATCRRRAAYDEPEDNPIGAAAECAASAAAGNILASAAADNILAPAGRQRIPPERGMPERTGVQAASDDRRVSPIRRRERFGPPGVTVGGSALQR